MTRFAPPAGLQGNAAGRYAQSGDSPATEVAIALMDLLVQAQKICPGSEAAAKEEGPDGQQAEC